MRKLVRPVFLVLCALQCAQAAPAYSSAEKAVSGKGSVGKGARIFIDKAHPAHSDLQDADFRQLADAKLTVVVRKWTHDNHGKEINLEQYVRRAARAGLAVMQWDYGAVAAQANDVPTINHLGKPTRNIAPLHPEAWRRLSETLIGYAQLSRKHPNFKGVLLDFEIYGENKTDGYCESYDDYTFRSFVESLGREVPQPLPAPDKRKDYLVNRQWYQMYISYHLNEMGRQVRQLRKRLDAINPNFQIGVYAWGFLLDPFIREMATAKAPVLILDATTYARAVWDNAVEGGYDAKKPDKEALKWALDYTKIATRVAHQTYDNVVLLPGHYSHAPGPPDQYKFTAKQAFQSAAFGEGYWIWSDWMTPKPFTSRKEWHDALVGYLGKANRAVDAKDWTWADREPETVPSRP